MHTCQICLHKYKTLRFKSGRISICGRCVNSLNATPEVAEHARARVGQLLLRGMERNALKDLNSSETWKQKKLQQTLSNPHAAYVAALPGWLNRLLAEPNNSTRDFKILRAHRRGLLHDDRPMGWGYPSSWKSVAARIRKLDNYQCVACGATNRILDVHHIVYVSNFGTHQQTNLVSLCRSCHEKEHQRTFDFGEDKNNADGEKTGPRVVDEKNHSSTEQEPATPLNHWVSLARESWKEHNPKLFKELKNSGALETALREAAERTHAEMSELEEDGLTTSEAWEMTREQYLLLPPEPTKDDDVVSEGAKLFNEVITLNSQILRMLSEQNDSEPESAPESDSQTQNCTDDFTRPDPALPVMSTRVALLKPIEGMSPQEKDAAIRKLREVRMEQEERTKRMAESKK